VEAKYLGTGLLPCGACGASLEVLSKSHGRKRAFFYACAAHNRKGSTVCHNNTLIPMTDGDDVILSLLEDELINPEVIAAAVERTRARAAGLGASIEKRRKSLGEHRDNPERAGAPDRSVGSRR
jgi:hypothetical protein